MGPKGRTCPVMDVDWIVVRPALAVNLDSLKDIRDLRIFWKNWGWRFEGSTNLSRMVILRFHLTGWSVDVMNNFHFIVSFAHPSSEVEGLPMTIHNGIAYENPQWDCASLRRKTLEWQDAEGKKLDGTHHFQKRSHNELYWNHFFYDGIRHEPDSSGLPSITSTEICLFWQA